jgi:hypothetical protein
MDLQRCLLEILAKFGVAELTAIANFINMKIDLLELELNKQLTFTNVLQDEFNEIEAKVRAGEALFQDYVQSSALLGVAKSLSPNCGNLGGVFQGVLTAADVVQSSVNDSVFVARQILTVNGLIQTAKNEISDAISFLKDIVGIIQLILLENAEDVPKLLGPLVGKTTELLPKG